MKPISSLLRKPRKRDFAGDCILTDTEEESGMASDLKQDELSQLPEARGHIPDGEEAFNNPPHQKRGCRKLALIANDRKPHTEEKSYKCTECRKDFKTRTTFLNHWQSHIREEMFECAECGKSFSRKAGLVVHRRIHTRKKHCKCKECDETFSYMSDLTAHCKTPVKKKAFSCTMSRKSFSGSAAVSQHDSVDMDEEPCRCNECGASFCRHSDFVKHQQIHLRERDSEQTAAANHSEFTCLHHKEDQRCGAEKCERDCLNLTLEDLKKMRENMDMLLQNHQSQLQVLQEIHERLNRVCQALILLIRASV